MAEHGPPKKARRTRGSRHDHHPAPDPDQPADEAKTTQAKQMPEEAVQRKEEENGQVRKQLLPLLPLIASPALPPGR